LKIEEATHVTRKPVSIGRKKFCLHQDRRTRELRVQPGLQNPVE
jgi:hypothetical protein